MKCTKCGSENVNVQMVSESKLKTKHHGFFYWCCFGWAIDMMLWIFLTIPRLLIAMFVPKKQKMSTKHKKMAICQNCGNNWKV